MGGPSLAREILDSTCSNMYDGSLTDFALEASAEHHGTYAAGCRLLLLLPCSLIDLAILSEHNPHSLTQHSVNRRSPTPCATSMTEHLTDKARSC